MSKVENGDVPWKSGSVPEEYIGLWSRRLLITPDDFHDRDTKVLWLQTNQHFADIRLPPNRPDFSVHSGFASLDKDHLVYLARQEGFAGLLEHKPGALAWRRAVDFQPPGGPPDEGWMERKTDHLYIETGMHQEYLEEWEKIEDATDQSLPVIAHWPEQSPDAPLIVRVGSSFMRVQDRRSHPLPMSLEDAVLPRQGDGAGLAELLDCEISYGPVSTSGMGVIAASTLPWFEGVSVDLSWLGE